MDEHEQDPAFWRERATQLQQALDSRVAIEQAKGILAERFGLDMEAAFSMLRGSARSQRVKINLLARAVILTPETPEPIIRWLGAHPEVVEQPPRAERVYRTELDFKRLNKALAGELADGNGHFLCECGNPYCNVTLELSAEDLRMLHSEEELFAIVPGHEVPDLEDVVMQNGGYSIVRKRMEKIREAVNDAHRA
jgi:ANTAR domain